MVLIGSSSLHMSAHSFIATGEVSDATEVNRAWLSNPTWFTVYTYRPWVWLHHHPTSSTPTLTLAYITLTLFLFLLLILQLPFFALYVSSLWNSLPVTWFCMWYTCFACPFCRFKFAFLNSLIQSLICISCHCCLYSHTCYILFCLW